MRSNVSLFWIGFILFQSFPAGASPLLVSIHFPDRGGSRLDAKGIEVVGQVVREGGGYTLTFDEWVTGAAAAQIRGIYAVYDRARDDRSLNFSLRLRLPTGPDLLEKENGLVHFRWSYFIGDMEDGYNDSAPLWRALDFGDALERDGQPLEGIKAISIPVRSRENIPGTPSANYRGVKTQSRGPYKYESFEGMACVVFSSGKAIPLMEIIDAEPAPQSGLARALSCAEGFLRYFVPKLRRSKHRDYTLRAGAAVPMY